MKKVQNILAYFLAGFLVPTIWHYVAAPFGYFAGCVAAIVVIAPVWYYKGMVNQDSRAATLDMGAAVGLAILMRDLLNKGFSSVFGSLPTLFWMSLGAILAGCIAHLLTKRRQKS
ncbi:Lin0368 family putative glycerol transporter subunit [Streptococcus caprae]|uniref:Lin0368 family putative glycerol transporter subunit n=1 Tax=Streptococcus caprae TaxID=1640501 RepID=A0ABV8CYH0_9STRE